MLGVQGGDQYEHDFSLVLAPKFGHGARASVQSPDLVLRHWIWYWHQSTHNFHGMPFPQLRETGQPLTVGWPTVADHGRL